jgi:xanthine dehydrogenase YagS FAD-binding subunit
MRSFEYARPETAEQAVQLLAAPGHEARGSLPVAGGSDLLSLLKDGVMTPGRLVDLNGLGDLAGVIEGDDGALWLGALTRIEVLAKEPRIAERHPALATAFGHVAAPQIRNVGTLGGNLCQRPRCWYFRLGYGLLARGADGASMVEAGDDRYHAILGNDGPAYFVSPSTVAPLLVALGAEVEAVGPEGTRSFPLSDLYRTPSADGESELTLAAGEIVSRVRVPQTTGGAPRQASYEVRQRRSLDWSLATAAVVLRLEGGRVARSRVVLGQVAPVPWPAPAAEAALLGREVDAAVAEKAAEQAVRGARALGRNGYKIQLAKTAVKRAVLAAAGASRGGE